MRREDGFTLPEVLIASLIGFIVLSAALGLLESTVRLGGGTMAKTDAMQRGRLAMDVVTRQLRSQVCAVGGQPAIVEADDNRVTFYADFGDGTTAPDQRTLALDVGKQRLVAAVHTGSGKPPGPYTFPSTPSRTEHILDNVVPQAGTPFLRYFAFSTGATPEPDVELAPPLDANARRRVARIEIAYSSRPTSSRDGKHAIGLRDQVMVRHADVNHSEPDPFCP
jgi:type II secretory pathway pseudopilin PulG